MRLLTWMQIFLVMLITAYGLYKDENIHLRIDQDSFTYFGGSHLFQL